MIISLHDNWFFPRRASRRPALCRIEPLYVQHPSDRVQSDHLRESHCAGVVRWWTACPPRLPLTEADIQRQLDRRRPGQSRLTTDRDEADTVAVLSGTETASPWGLRLALLVHTRTAAGRLRLHEPGARVPPMRLHYQVKYGIRAASGGGRASARETVGRVAAGAVAEKFLRSASGGNRRLGQCGR